ncbi:MAG: VapC toxin family PIN domain ribonuclease, partial [Candidatus Edwardsbacteria bacterium]|nr:VapC toxin family PIN domain ribonuclease [Candidatus Edwardsbacteria bacterium]
NLDEFISLIESAKNYQIEPLCLPIINLCKSISRNVLPDPWDRMIAATSLKLKYPLITKDTKIRNLGISVVW